MLFSRCVIWNPDIFGYDSGMTRQLADRLSKEINVTVIVVDYFREDYPIIGSPNFRQKMMEKHNWELLKQDWEGITKPYAEEHGCKIYGVHGTRQINYFTYL